MKNENKYYDHVVLRDGEEFVEDMPCWRYWEVFESGKSDVRRHPHYKKANAFRIDPIKENKKSSCFFLKMAVILAALAIVFSALFSSRTTSKKVDDGFENLRKTSLSEKSVTSMKKASEEAIEIAHENELYCEGSNYTKMYPNATRYEVSSIEFQYGYVSALVDPSQYSYNTPDNYAVLIYKVELAGVNRKEGITETVYSPVCFRNIKANSNGRLLNSTESEFYISNGEFSDSLAVDTGGFLTPQEAEEHVSESGYEKVSEIK